MIPIRTATERNTRDCNEETVTIDMVERLCLISFFRGRPNETPDVCAPSLRVDGVEGEISVKHAIEEIQRLGAALLKDLDSKM